MTYGIDTVLAGRISLRGNDIVGDGTAGSYGLKCFGAQPVTRDNAVSRFETGSASCGDAGGNVYNP